MGHQKCHNYRTTPYKHMNTLSQQPSPKTWPAGPLWSGGIVAILIALVSLLWAGSPSRAQTTSAAPPASPPTAAPAATPAPPPSAPAKRSAADLEKLAMPIALHPDPLI